MAKKVTSKKSTKNKKKPSARSRSTSGTMKIECVRTQKRCRCNGQNGYLYECPSLGTICLPLDDTSVSIEGITLRGLCTATSCDSMTGLECDFKVRIRSTQRTVRGSIRTKVPIVAAAASGCSGGCGAAPAALSSAAPVEILCVNTGVPCKHGNIPGNYWKCTEPNGNTFLACVPLDATSITGVKSGSAVPITAQGAEVEYKIADGTIQSAQTHMLCGCSPDPHYVAATHFDPRILCTPTATKCKCDGEDGYVYDCGPDGFVCIPTKEDPPKSHRIKKVMGLSESCATPKCDTNGSPHAKYDVDGTMVTGSARPKP